MKWIINSLLLLLTTNFVNGFTYNFDLEYSNEHRFSTALDSDYILDTFNNTKRCENYCIVESKCYGYYTYNDSDTTICNALSNLGTPIDSILAGNSYKKTTNYHNNEEDNTLLTIYLFEYTQNNYVAYYDNTNISIYIDINHNNQYDKEIDLLYESVNINTPLYIHNLSRGIYNIKQIIHNTSCSQLYPGENGSYFDVDTSGYADKVISYYHDGNSGYNNHESIGNPHGGIVGQSQLFLNSNFSFLLGENNNTYLSFFPGDKIEIHLTSDIVHDNSGTDIFFNIYNNTFTNNYAHVYVGTLQNNMTFLDVLNYTHYEFDLTYYDVPSPIRYISLEFFGDEHIHFNLKNILFQRLDKYSVPYSYTTDLTSGGDALAFFVNTCELPIDCESYCDFNLYNNAHYYSCIHGCKMFERYHYCDCETSDFKEEIFSYFSYNYYDNYCNYGCQYAFDNYLGSNYSVLLNTRVSDETIIGTFSFNNRGLLDRLVTECNDELYCESISLGDETGFTASTENTDDMISNHSFITILKNRIPTTTQTSTLTSTPSSTLSTSQTSTPSSTLSTSQTSTPSSTLSTSQTTTQTTSTTPTTTLTTFTNSIIENSSLEYYYIIIIVALIVVIAIAFILYYRTLNRTSAPPDSHITPSFSNPMYDQTPSNVDDIVNDGSSTSNLNTFNAYQDVIADTPSESGIYYETNDDNYLDISHDPNDDTVL